MAKLILILQIIPVLAGVLPVHIERDNALHWSAFWAR